MKRSISSLLVMFLIVINFTGCAAATATLRWALNWIKNMNMRTGKEAFSFPVFLRLRTDKKR